MTPANGATGTPLRGADPSNNRRTTVALSRGDRLGPYHIVAPVGAGGFGEVYEARDTRLDRTVAIKVLPSTAPELKARFEREAKAIAALQHPHICTLHDIGHADGVDYLVMEDLEGETLADRIVRGPLALDDALKVGAAVAEALDAAHRAGIIHRDLKPANIMLTRSGVKLLDFGIAKLKSVTQSREELPTVATMTAVSLTNQGAVVGTLHYMSPEQIEGREVDARTDVWSLGLVLDEMLTGVRTFSGTSSASIAAAIVATTPAPLSTRRPNTPRSLERLVASCLAKDRDARFHSAHDVALLLRSIVDERLDTPEPIGRNKWARPLAVAIAVAAIVISVIAWRSRPTSTAAPAFPVSFAVTAPPDATFLPAPMFLTIAPDGRTLAAVGADAGGTRHLWVRNLNSTQIRMLPGTEDVDQPFWSADSRELAFLDSTDSKLKRIDINGGPKRVICDVPGGLTLQGGTWNEHGLVLFGTIGGGNPIFSVPAAGGTATPVTALDRAKGEVTHVWPHFLPDGEHFLYLSINTQSDRSGIDVARIGQAGSTRVLDALSNVAYSEPGFLLFARERRLLAQPFDARALTITGNAVVIAEGLGPPPGNGRSAFAASRNGVLAYRPGGDDLYSSVLTWFDRSGRKLGVIGGPNAYRSTVLSPDGTRVAAQVGWTVGSDVWIAEVSRGLFTRLTSSPANDESPVWSPDSTRIAFGSNREGGVLNLYDVAADGSSPERRVFASEHNKRPLQWSADGKWLLVDSDGLIAVALDEQHRTLPVGDRESVTTFGQLSTDSEWLAFTSRDSGRLEIYVRRFLTPSRKWQVSTQGGTRPHWRADGKELFYLGLDNAIYAVPVTLGSTPTFGSPTKLFTVRLTSTLQGATQFDGINVTPDGQRFLVTLQTENSADQPVTVRVNWPAGLPR
jgi:eukaryotic-like serine/threonine-protein kinase